jgi:trigger factor
LNIQTEHLENHTARLTVEVAPERLESAKQSVVRKLARGLEVPGFRKGKAPSHLVLRYVGEARIFEDAIEELGQAVYRETLDASDVKPYGPGSLEDVKTEPTLTFIYTVPLQPSVDLGDYRSVRLEYTPPAITDADVERAVLSLQDKEANATPSEAPAAAGDRLTIDVHSFFVEDEDDHDEGDHDEYEDQDESSEDIEMVDEEDDDEMDEDTDELDEADDEDDHHAHDHSGEPYIHEHDLKVVLREGEDDEPLGPGFTAAMIGATVGETREFVLTYPTQEENPEISPDVAGRAVEFVITVKQIEKVMLPALDDEFAAKFTDRFALPDEIAQMSAETSATAEDETAEEETVSDMAAEPVESAEGGDDSVDDGNADDTEDADYADDAVDDTPKLTMVQLRERIRAELTEDAERMVNQGYGDKVLDEMVKGATVAFPEAMLDEQLDSMIENLDQRLRQQGITLDMYRSLTGKTREDIRNDYRDQAETMIKRSLVMFEVAVAEKLQVTADDFEAYIQETMQRLGFISPEFRKTFDNPSVRENVFNRILQDKTFDRMVMIGKGEAPALPETTSEAVKADAPESTEVTAETASVTSSATSDEG